jgi:hypothetical protein
MIGSIIDETPRYSVFERKPAPHAMRGGYRFAPRKCASRTTLETLR